MTNSVYTWLDLPLGVDFATRQGWRQLPHDVYAANRALVLLVRREPTHAGGYQPRHGPPERVYTVRANDTYTIQLINEKVVREVQTLENAIGASITARVCDEWTVKLS